MQGPSFTNIQIKMTRADDHVVKKVLDLVQFTHAKMFKTEETLKYLK